MNKTTFLIKRTYNRAIDKVLGISGKLDYAIKLQDEQILKLADARTLCKKAKLDDKVAELETKIRELYSKKKELIQKKAELEAKVSMLEATKTALMSCADIEGITSADSVVSEVEEYIEQLEAEINTFSFISNIKKDK